MSATEAVKSADAPVPALLTPAEVGERLAIGSDSVRALIRKRQMRAVLVSVDPRSRKPLLRVHAEDLDAFIARRTLPAVAPPRRRKRRRDYERVV